jgi:hypothetical protein
VSRSRVQTLISPPGHSFATSRSFSALRSLLMAASRFRAADLDFWGSL